MRIAVVFDTPYSGWDHLAHERQMQHEVGAWKAEEPGMEYQIAHALHELGHEVRLLGVCDDLQYLVRCLSKWEPNLIFNAAEAFRGEQSLLHPSALWAGRHRRGVQRRSGAVRRGRRKRRFWRCCR